MELPLFICLAVIQPYCQNDKISINAADRIFEQENVTLIQRDTDPKDKIFAVIQMITKAIEFLLKNQSDVIKNQPKLKFKIPPKLIRSHQSIEQMFKDEDGQTVEFFLRHHNQSEPMMTKRFSSQKHKMNLDLNLELEGNILIVKTSFSEDVTKKKTP